jgi:hypothetical protein
MTAPVDRTVKQTFSVRPQISTGLPGFQAHQANGQQFSNFGNSFMVCWADHAAKGQRSGLHVQVFHVKSCATVLERTQ